MAANEQVFCSVSRHFSSIRSSSQMAIRLAFGCGTYIRSMAVEGSSTSTSKGSERRAVHALGLEPVLCLYYESQSMDRRIVKIGLIDRVIQFEGCEEVESFIGTADECVWQTRG